MNEPSAQINSQVTDYCLHEPRYRVAWLIGPPLSGKTFLVRQLCRNHGWYYLDYTRTPGYFDTLAEQIVTYGPHQLTAALQDWCNACAAPILVVDEIDAVLATWSRDECQLWANQVSRLPYLSCGVIIVTHLLDCVTLAAFLPDRGQRSCFTLSRKVGSL